MRPVAPFRLSLLRTSLGTRPPPIHQQPTKSQQSYFRRLDNSIAEKFGIGKSMRITLYVILGVTSAIETWFYCFWTWQWWKRRAGQESEDVVES
ncbi:hypothetical protein B0H14DRAFT_2829218 [Mycena olivaceomarginata]|nr:hypothetical protein B0H14DRAFT_2829218 [Mycena olivaceomarginata]